MGDKTGLIILAVAATVGFAYFLFVYIYNKIAMRKLGYVALRNAQIAEELYLERRGSRKERIARWLRDAGYDKDPWPLALLGAGSYFFLAAGLNLVGVSPVLALIVAAPGALVVAMIVIKTTKRRADARIPQQTVQLLRNAVTHLESGSTPQQAFQKSAQLLDNPLRRELLDALAARVGTEPLAHTLQPIADRHPSQAMSLMLAALEVNDKVGSRLAPTLKQAELVVEQQLELSAEATAEVSQAKGEFIGVATLIGLIGLAMVAAAGESAREAYLSPLGLFALTLGIGNFAFGVFRILRTLNKAKEGKF